MFQLTPKISVRDSEITLLAIRAQGAGGQNVNKVSSAIQLRFDVLASSLSAEHKVKILSLNNHHLTKDGVVVIKAQRFRTQEQNQKDAYQRLRELLAKVFAVVKKRKPTKPTKGAKIRRVDSKTKRGQIKANRRRVGDD